MQNIGRISFFVTTIMQVFTSKAIIWDNEVAARMILSAGAPVSGGTRNDPNFTPLHQWASRGTVSCLSWKLFRGYFY